jgi:D-alanine-D-alanine ligase
MTVGVLHDRVPPVPSRDELDTLVQVEAVSRSLTDLGYSPVSVEFHYDIDAIIETIGRLDPPIVFNLAESLRGKGQFISFAPLVLEYLNVPYTGCPARAIFLTSDKILTKKTLSLAGIPTPPWLSLEGPGGPAGVPEAGGGRAGRFIVKSVWEHASIGLDGEAVVEAESARELRGLLEKRNRPGAGSFFAERYIEGREFNISLLGGARRPALRGKNPPEHGDIPPPDVLAPAEMTFDGFPDGTPRILGYRAKWDEGSREFASTVRRFEFPGGDAPLIRNLSELSLRCWDTFGLNGYARVDFRVDAGGKPFVLEINANPCIAPDSGFVAAAAKSGLGFRDVIERIIQNPVLKT